MSLELSSQASDILQQRLATGLYASEEDAIVQGLHLLVEQESSLAGIRRGLASMERGEGIPLEEAFAEIRRRHGLVDAP
jgi:predicted transcriptional regulator